MRPTKEMIMATEALVEQANKEIRQIIRQNDAEMKNIRKKSTPPQIQRVSPWLVFLLLLALFGLLISCII